MQTRLEIIKEAILNELMTKRQFAVAKDPEGMAKAEAEGRGEEYAGSVYHDASLASEIGLRKQSEQIRQMTGPVDYFTDPVSPIQASLLKAKAQIDDKAMRRRIGRERSAGQGRSERYPFIPYQPYQRTGKTPRLKLRNDILRIFGTEPEK